MEKVDITFDLKSLFIKLIKSWKKIIICALVFALLFGIFGAYKGNQEYKVKTAFYEKTSDVKYNSFTMQDVYRIPGFEKYVIDTDGGIKEDAMFNADIAYSKYLIYRKGIESINSYLGKGIYPNLNMLATSKYEEIYMIETSSPDLELISNTVKEYVESRLVNNELLIEIADKEYGDVPENSYLYDNLVYINDSVLKAELLNASMNLKISMVGDSKESAKNIKEIVDKKIGKILSDLEKDYSIYNIKLTLLSESYIEAEEAGITTVRNSKLDTLKKYQTAVSEITVGGGGDYIYNGLVRNTNKSFDNDVVFVKDLVNGKAIVYGFILGAFLMCLYLGLKFLFQKELRRSKDIEDIFNIPVFYEFKDLDKENISRTSKDIELTIKELGLKSCFLGGTRIEKVDDLRKEFYKALNKALEIKEKADKEDKNMSLMSESDSIVLFYEVDKSKYKDINKEIELAKRMGCKVIGAVTFKG